jgi:hypothetical protein
MEKKWYGGNQCVSRVSLAVSAGVGGQRLDILVNAPVITAKTLRQCLYRRRWSFMYRTQQFEALRRNRVQHYRQIGKGYMPLSYFLPVLESVPCVHKTLTHLVQSSHVDFDALAVTFRSKAEAAPVFVLDDSAGWRWPIPR